MRTNARMALILDLCGIVFGIVAFIALVILIIVVNANNSHYYYPNQEKILDILLCYAAFDLSLMHLIKCDILITFYYLINDFDVLINSGNVTIIFLCVIVQSQITRVNCRYSCYKFTLLKAELLLSILGVCKEPKLFSHICLPLLCPYKMQ